MVTDKKYLVEFYKVEAEKYNKTRDVQWKMNLAFWTVLIVAIYSKTKEGFTLDSLPLWLQAIILILFIYVHSIFIFQIQGSLNRSLGRMRNLGAYLVEKEEKDTTSINEIEQDPFKDNAEYKSRTKKWHLFQISITIFLVVLFFILKPKPCLS